LQIKALRACFCAHVLLLYVMKINDAKERQGRNYRG